MKSETEQELRIAIDVSLTIPASLGTAKVRAFVVRVARSIVAFNPGKLNEVRYAEEAAIYHGESVRWTSLHDTELGANPRAGLQLCDRDEQLFTLQAQQEFCEAMRDKLGLHEPDEALAKYSVGDDRDVLVIADGYGGATDEEVQGDWPLDFQTLRARAFATEQEALLFASDLDAGSAQWETDEDTAQEDRT